MAAPMLTVLAKSVDVVGIRIGFACFIFSFALLTGNPLSGVLLHQSGYLWSHAIFFNAVDSSYLNSASRPYMQVRHHNSKFSSKTDPLVVHSSPFDEHRYIYHGSSLIYTGRP
ncbi:hypothetical protein BD311DRAFT_326328 [Dichomitus squalens]|uniref:Uncharacterized protein n=1 Tax=Dichomitus squalens TaxID=114155 RepID=A0A4Q9MN46_9APHY|nr:hypothetical protein BD311DRAFT_326328 [Dichomitus squalens]